MPLWNPCKSPHRPRKRVRRKPPPGSSRREALHRLAASHDFGGRVAETSDVYFVDGMRTPFGRAGEKGMYWNTRADDLVVKAIVGLLERNPSVPKDRIDDVAIAATT